MTLPVASSDVPLSVGRGLVMSLFQIFKALNQSERGRAWLSSIFVGTRPVVRSRQHSKCMILRGWTNSREKILYTQERSTRKRHDLCFTRLSFCRQGSIGNRALFEIVLQPSAVRENESMLFSERWRQLSLKEWPLASLGVGELDSPLSCRRVSMTDSTDTCARLRARETRLQPEQRPLWFIAEAGAF